MIGYLVGIALVVLAGAGAGSIGGILGLSAGGCGALAALGIIVMSYAVKGFEAEVYR